MTGDFGNRPKSVTITEIRTGAEPRPLQCNYVAILVDQLGYGESPASPGALKNVMTPNYAERIDADEPWQAGYWSGRFGVSRTQLAEAMEAVGCRVLDVQRHLREMKNQTPSCALGLVIELASPSRHWSSPGRDKEARAFLGTYA